MENNKIFAIIPARGGSKRLKNKNVYPLFGKPLIQYTIDAALTSKYLSYNNLYVSTENQKIKETVKDIVKVIDRPEELSSDKIWTQNVVNHFSKELSLNEDDIIVILQANSPQMTGEVIDMCIEKLLNENLWQVHTIDENFINNGAIHVLKNFVANHKGKVNYNGVIKTNWIDVHTIEDISELEKLKSLK